MQTVSIIDNLVSIRTIIKNATAHKQSVGFVPTMGNLHPGHASLLARSRAENDISILSIFVNPTQFNNAQDFEKYPRTLDNDCKIAREQGVDYIFLPHEKLLYPNGYRYYMSERDQDSRLEGLWRPGHFTGMLTIVMKLLLIIQPTRAYFGEKDYQQYQLIQGLAEDFFLETHIIPCPTIRENTGLAFSSRNNLLSPARRIFAAHFFEYLTSTQDDTTVGHRLNALGFKVDYITTEHNRRYGAVWLDGVRLIDNTDNSGSVNNSGKTEARDAV